MNLKLYARILLFFVIFSASLSSATINIVAEDIVHNVGTYLEVEAESLTCSSNMNKVALEDASGGYAMQRTGSMNSVSSENDIVFNVNVSNEGRYIFYLRLKTSSSYITYYTKLNSGGKSNFISKVPTGRFLYFPVDSYYLTKGTHKIVFTYRHCGYYIDSLVLTTLSHEDMFDGGVYDYTKHLNNTFPAEYDLPEVLRDKVHPRLIIEKDKIGEIKQNLTHPQNIRFYERLLKAAEKNYPNCLLNTNKSNNHNYDYLDYIEANAFLYALYKTEENAQKAISGVKDYLKTYYAAYSNLAESREACNLIFRASLVYDWCYDVLTEDDKNYIINQSLLLFAASEHGRDGTHNLNAYNSDHGEEYVLIKNMLGFAVATFDEIPFYFRNVAERILGEFVPSRNVRYENSDFNQQGDNYGIFRSGADSFLALILHNLGRGDLLTENQRMQAYQPIYRKNANGAFMRDGDCYSLPILGGYESPSGYTAILFIQSLLSGDEYLKGEYLTLRANSSSNSNADSMISDAMHLALNDVNVLPKHKNDLPLSKYFGDKSGVMVARTSWEDGINSNAMTVSMKVSENNMGGHGHSDSGHFYIYYKGPLTVDSGVYEPTTGNKNEHLNNYYRLTIAHNSLLIGGKGQKRISGIDTYDKMFSGTQFGEVLGYDFGSDLNKPDYTYLKGDLTKAYDGLADEYTRSFMFFNFFDNVYPGALVVFDKINSANPNDEKTYLLHSQNEPEISGSRVTIRNTTSYGYNGKLINDVLLPKENLSIKKVEGYITDTGDYTVGKAHATGIGDESGNYRVEISSTDVQKTEYRLNVLQVSENDDSITPLPASLIENEKIYGAKIKDRVAIFSKQRNRTEENVSFSLEFDENLKIAVCDLKEGKWNVYKDGSLHTIADVSQNGGVAYFDGGKGDYVLSFADSGVTPKDLGIFSNLRDNPDSIRVHRSNIKVNSSGTTISNYEYVSDKPVKSDGEILVSINSMADVFSFSTEEKADYVVLKTNSKNVMKVYKNSVLVDLNGTLYASDAKSFKASNGSWYVQASALNGFVGCNTKYNDLSEILYFSHNSSPENKLTLLGDADDVTENCVITKTGITMGSDGSTASVSAELYNYSGKDHEFDVCFAIYKYGKLVDVKLSKKAVRAVAENTFTRFNNSVSNLAPGNKAKLFILKGGTLIPASDNAEITYALPSEMDEKNADLKSVSLPLAPYNSNYNQQPTIYPELNKDVSEYTIYTYNKDYAIKPLSFETANSNATVTLTKEPNPSANDFTAVYTVKSADGTVSKDYTFNYVNVNNSSKRLYLSNIVNIYTQNSGTCLVTWNGHLLNNTDHSVADVYLQSGTFNRSSTDIRKIKTTASLIEVDISQGPETIKGGILRLSLSNTYPQANTPGTLHICKLDDDIYNKENIFNLSSGDITKYFTNELRSVTVNPKVGNNADMYLISVDPEYYNSLKADGRTKMYFCLWAEEHDSTKGFSAVFAGSGNRAPTNYKISCFDYLN